MVSIIIPTFNRRALIRPAIESVLKQTDRDFELIIVDDGSTDGTDVFIRETFFDTRIHYERLEKNQGVHAARNRGLEIARGAFIVFWDSDDELFPEAIETERKIFEQHPDVGVVAAPLRINDTEEITGLTRQEGLVPFEDILCERDIRGKKAGVTMMRREAIGTARFVMRNLDFIFFRRVIRGSRYYYYPNPLGTYWLSEIDTGSLHMLRRIPNIHFSIARAQHIDVFLDDFAQDFERTCPAKMAPYAYGAAVGLLLAGHRKQAHARIKLGLRFQRWNVKWWIVWFLSLFSFGPWILRGVFQVARSFFLKMKKTA